ncbi:MAG: redox-sensing transcriptional repressor Rex, partial [Defluviitaleaceae bacterium]|nr:redox-sensing transcriptional repressor Rex [Defluviitaleaceae bacterium]
SLYSKIAKILGLTRGYSLIAVGGGHLGQALARDVRFEQRGFFFRALFDIDPLLIGTFVNGIEVLSADALENYVKENPVDIAALTLPNRESAERSLERLVDCGVKAIWNFSHVDLDLSAYPNVVVENVHLTDSLMMLSYKLETGS